MIRLMSLSNLSMPDQIQAILQAQLHATVVEVEDDSHRHAGHRGNSGGGHYTVVVVSPDFVDKTTMQRHRMVYDALAAEMQTTIHALSLKTLTPDQWTP